MTQARAAPRRCSPPQPGTPLPSTITKARQMSMPQLTIAIAIGSEGIWAAAICTETVMLKALSQSAGMAQRA